jgi:hypothetical protein
MQSMSTSPNTENPKNDELLVAQEVYSVPGMRNCLQRHGFSYKKPALVPGKANEQQQREWMAEYDKLKQNLPLDETICFNAEAQSVFFEK